MYPFPFSVPLPHLLFTAIVKNQFTSFPALNHEVPYSLIKSDCKGMTHTEWRCTTWAWPQASSFAPMPPPTPSKMSDNLFPIMPTKSPHRTPSPRLKRQHASHLTTSEKVLNTSMLNENHSHPQLNSATSHVTPLKHTLNYSSSLPLFFFIHQLLQKYHTTYWSNSFKSFQI